MKTENEKKFAPVGHKRWVIAEGWIPPTSHGPEPAMLSHETACMLNVSDQDANVEITIFYADRAPVGPYKISVPAKRTVHMRFNNLKDPEPIPRGTNYASVIESDVLIVVQHTRLDSRQSENALMTTMAFPDRQTVT
ncbi:MAG TPA: sensory rhodopsin transducer [Verrucomicrobiae bacterium]